jgi:hypothetical protein
VIYDFRNRFATHQPVLWTIANESTGPIAEFGCGHGSTPLLHGIAEARGVSLLTLDGSREWLDRFRPRFESPQHEFRVVDDWDAELGDPRWDEQRYLVFVDQGPFEARAATVARVRHSADYVVLHDSDYFPEHGLFGRAVRPLLGAHDRGERNYDDVFSSWREFFPPEPWPYSPTGPPTLLGSNRCDVARFEIDYDDFLPRWWKLGRTVRGLMPRRVRMELANRAGWGRS